MANCGRQNVSAENARFELFYGYQKGTTARSCVCVKHNFSLSKANILKRLYPTFKMQTLKLKFQPLVLVLAAVNHCRGTGSLVVFTVVIGLFDPLR